MATWIKRPGPRLLALLLLASFFIACERTLDPELERQEDRARREIAAALDGGRTDLARTALRAFAGEIDAAERRGTAPPSQIAAARTFAKAAFERVAAVRDEERAAQIAEQIAIYLADGEYDPARRYVRASLDQLRPSKRLESRLLELLAQIDAAERGARTSESRPYPSRVSTVAPSH